ncbi:molybdopterin-guanine dinucleotide biosynthesis protein MobA [Paenibacillus jamilae]|uniref:Molybdopterin-guanine dinucleotide biosynthesis protein MobA n=1 Tax=Paenibacillus jamilae TaxID=114136 RepID=A0ACC4ZX95_9BACL|nr:MULTISPECIES: molybdenum cofactor guanylyltransferase [Paenibacillus]AJE52052.1 molybdopterin-guanine dinucleotide biosynthesis protein MobA [Paenibacillus polymyxa]AUO06829.1 molybdenum cofactor guanylyltransferase [Paenibacillus sp. lzh-N1]KTS82859.1 molybdopterin-guanine dinucleotide biosynthesis protein MobA [Paenibacillus jamilae]MDG0054525.1 molybdenum cofactor guanylyltransferase [Paenibacillus sp. P2(2022)]OAZ50848.1 molybdenum cofactor guanylyltransferase [Paenibacillus polymyxa]
MEVTGIIIAGGRSSRMGQDKALLEIEGATMLERTYITLQQATQRVIVVTRDDQGYEQDSMEAVSDIYPGMGPLSGIHAGLSASTTEWGIVVACDMPFVQLEVLQALLVLTEKWAASKGAAESPLQAVIASVAGRMHPLLGVYHRSVLPSAEERLRNKRLRLTEWLETLNVRYATIADMPGVTENIWHNAVFNMNNPQDYKLVLEQFRKD